MRRCYLLHIVAIWRLGRAVRQDASRAVQALFETGLLRCAATLDDSPVPEGVQTVVPTFEELLLANGFRRGLGLVDRVLLTLGRTRQLTCVSDEPSLAEVAREFHVELLDTPQLLDELTVGGHLAGPDHTRRAAAPHGVGPGGVQDVGEHPILQPVANPREVAARGRRPAVRTRGRRNVTPAAGEQLHLLLNGTTRER